MCVEGVGVGIDDARVGAGVNDVGAGVDDWCFPYMTNGRWVRKFRVSV